MSVPWKVELTPRVAELPTCQKMFFACAPLTSRTLVLPKVVRAEPIWKMKTALEFPWASRVRLPEVRVTAEAFL